MKKMRWALILLIAISLALTGCTGDIAEAVVVIENSSQYELETITFQIPQSSGAYSPMKYILTAEDDSLKPDGEHEAVISLVDADFGNSGSAIIDAREYASPEGLDYTKGEVVLQRGTNRFRITHDGETFVITAVNGTDDSSAAAPE